ncbi:MAG: amidohydrolase [Pseudomonadota bacterium]|nr:amidohydrolase [Pseudomonadota bacterium]
MEAADTLITGGRVVTMDEKDTIHGNGAVAVAQGKIVAVGPAEEIQKRFSARRTIRADHRIVMPGLINAHTHAAMTCFRGFADDMELMTWWKEYIFPAETRAVSPELAYWGTTLACAEMIRSGTTCFCDMYFFTEETAQAAKRAGMRCLIGEVLLDFPSANAKSPAAGLEYTRKLIEKWSGDPLVRIAVEPHALYTCSEDVLKESRQLARRYDVPVATHFLENQAEVGQLTEKYGKKAIHYLRDIGFLHENLILFHGVCMDDEDMRICADYGCKVVHNPESNMKLASGVAPVGKMLARGITVALGTDGCASNNNLDMFQEMDTAAKLAKVAALDPTILPASSVLRMATRNGARAMGLARETGALEEGMQADIILIDTRKPHLTPLYNDYSHLVYAVSGADVETVMIDGRVVMEAGRLLTIDEEEAMARVNEIAGRVRGILS